ncbi:MAG: outer membrane beta-barrel domain-containing protein [Bdellovibrionales bacterium]|nr:outer membrane beta-barrel domain-containing protein [Bdellovibrionales bacterium]
MQWLNLVFALFASAAFAQTANTPAEPEFDSLGGNRVLLERAKAMNPDQTVSVVQNRTVDRRNRVEFAPEISGVMGGDTYSRARSVGLNAYYHFNPRFAVGAKFGYSFNTLTPEGQALLDQANHDFQADPETPSIGYPDVDYQKTEWMGLLNWYPLYGKFSVLDRRVIHFDFYVVGGAGQTTLRSGPASTYTGGIGMGLWLTQHFTTRMEARYQTYEAKYFTGARRLDLTVASLQMGWLL